MFLLFLFLFLLFMYYVGWMVTASWLIGTGVFGLVVIGRVYYNMIRKLPNLLSRFSVLFILVIVVIIAWLLLSSIVL